MVVPDEAHAVLWVITGPQYLVAYRDLCCASVVHQRHDREGSGHFLVLDQKLLVPYMFGFGPARTVP